MRNSIWLGLSLVIILILLPFLFACSDDGKTEEPPVTKTEEPTATVEPTNEPEEPVIITFGNLSDFTGPAASVMEPINMAVDDVVEYFNEQNLIPGVKLEVVTYDGQYDPANGIPGYEWLKERGADVILCDAATGPPLVPRATKDEVPVFMHNAPEDVLDPAGYVFATGVSPESLGYTMLGWIIENDWDHVTNGPAKIGAAGWDDGVTQGIIDAMENYAQAHPDQFEFVGGFITSMANFDWSTEVEALKNCDYIFPPGAIMFSFAEQYRSAGYTAKFLGGSPQAAFMGMIYDAQMWDEIDGSLFFLETRWWTDEEGSLLELTKQLLYENHADSAEKIKRTGNGYMVVAQIYMILDLIKTAAEAVGPENLDSKAIYDAAQSWTMTVDGIERYSTNETKRNPPNYVGVYEAAGADKNLFRADPDWVPLKREP
ncbi:MAG: ABC transporter substrate-binding protein [Dehalococcoidia bacterium]